MDRSPSRRHFLQTSALAGSGVALGDLAGLFASLPRVSAEDVKTDPKVVKLDSGIEPLVELIEKTPRDRLLEEVAARIRGGTTYKEVLAALQLAGVRNVPPRPSVGFKFHAVLVVNSAHLASQASPEADRWMPIFWALDNFKSAEATDQREGGWTMAPVKESAVPSPAQAKEKLIAALENWDAEAADVATAGFVRAAKPEEVFELFARFGARDFRSIGHKAIFVANSWRTLQTIGWQHAEPVLRSLAFALVNHQGDATPSTSDLPADRPGRRNLELAKKIRADWQMGKTESAPTTAMLTALRTASPEDCCDQVISLLNAGFSPQSIWDGLFLGASELLMRQQGIVSLHGSTTTNALHFAFNQVKDAELKKLFLLQNAAFLPLFRQAMASRGAIADAQITKLKPQEGVKDDPEIIGDIFRNVSGDKATAARQTLAWLDKTKDADALLTGARRLVYLKGRDSHDYKFSAAVLEDFNAVSPEHRNRFLAGAVYMLRGSGEKDSALVARTRAALKG